MLFFFDGVKKGEHTFSTNWLGNLAASTVEGWYPFATSYHDYPIAFWEDLQYKDDYNVWNSWGNGHLEVGYSYGWVSVLDGGVDGYSTYILGQSRKYYFENHQTTEHGLTAYHFGTDTTTSGTLLSAQIADGETFYIAFKYFTRDDSNPPNQDQLTPTVLGFNTITSVTIGYSGRIYVSWSPDIPSKLQNGDDVIVVEVWLKWDTQSWTKKGTFVTSSIALRSVDGYTWQLSLLVETWTGGHGGITSYGVMYIGDSYSWIENMCYGV